MGTKKNTVKYLTPLEQVTKRAKQYASRHRFQTDDELADDLKDALVEFNPSLNVYSSSGDGRTEVRLTVNRKRVRK